jgi:hypothetical protein
MFNLKITTESAAFFDTYGRSDPGAEVARILRQLADKLESDYPRAKDYATILDANGNATGLWTVTP